MTDWKAKGVNVSLKRGTSRKRAVENEIDGSRAGHSVDHWDGSNDVVATPKSVHLKVKAMEEQ